MAEYVLEMKHITKRYGENTVLSDVSLSVKPGEIHALLGENGAGKSTLMNTLFGMPVIHSTGGFEGEVCLNGETVHVLSPYDAMEKGIGMVHQEFMLLPGFTIMENIKLNREITRPNLVSRVLGKNLETLDVKAMAADARKALDSVGMTIDEFTMVAGLPVGYMQFVEIAREIDKTGIKLLVFDEPTAVLTESEASQLIKVMKDISRRGIAIIFITHRLDEVMAAADNITILRDGKLVAVRETKDTSVTELAELMVGRKGESVVEMEQRTAPQDKVAMRIEDLQVDMPGETVRGVSLDIYEGEILGIGGLAGQGKLGIPNGVMSLYDVSGKVEFFGQELKLGDTKAALNAGNAMQIKDEYLLKMGPIRLKNAKSIREEAEEMIRELDIRCFGPTQAVGTLSGGNQQKVCIARALCIGPKFLFVSEPTRGIDIGAKKLVLETLVKLNRERGMTVVIVSSELQELRSISDRIAIVSEGKLVDILSPHASEGDFGLAMSGIKPSEHRSKEGDTK